MEISPDVTARRRTLGICVMTIVPLLQIATEYLGTGDSGRALSKLAVSIVGLPILVWASPVGLRWAARRRLGPLVLIVGGLLSLRTLYALAAFPTNFASLSVTGLRPHPGACPPPVLLPYPQPVRLTSFHLRALH